MVGSALSGHLCRCGAYDNILEAVALACAGRFEDEAIVAPRVEAREKVTGAAKYTVDIRHENQQEGLILRSQSAHARVVEVDLAPALAISGVGAAALLLSDDQIVRCVGAPIAAVAATDRATARRALAAIRIVSKSLPSVVGLDAAREPGAPIVFGRSQRKQAGNVSEGTGGPTRWTRNVRGPTAPFSHGARKARNWISSARESRDPLLVEGTFRTGAQCHTCLEPHAAVARFDKDRLTLHVSTQAVFHLKALVARRFKLNPDHVTVIAHHVGGGFGSKVVLGVEATAAIELARQAKAPVRVVFDRQEELTVTSYRPAAELKVALLASHDGDLKALSMTAHADTGAGVNSTIAALARLIYPAQAKDFADYDVVSNLAPGAPCRGPGGPPMAFALEQAVDEAALRLGVDPIALRKRWDPDPNRQRLYDSASRTRRLARWTRQGAPGRGKPGASGAASALRRDIGSISGNPAPGSILSVTGGRIVVSTAIQDIGTGSRTVLANTVAREFGLDPSEIEVRIGESGPAGRTGFGRQPDDGVDTIPERCSPSES